MIFCSAFIVGSWMVPTCVRHKEVEKVKVKRDKFVVQKVLV